MASEIMNLQDPLPAHLPSPEVSRHIRDEAATSRRLDNNPMKSLQIMKHSRNPVNMFAIHDIGLDLFLYIFTPQIRLRSITLIAVKTTRDSSDTTSKLVHRIQKHGIKTSSHILLYLRVIRVTATGEGLIPVTQMLSERHNSNGIKFWLAEWLRAGAPVPNGIVLDDSAAIISAICKIFGKEPSTAAYIEKCFHYLEGHEWAKPNCLIRIDMAHLTNLICK